MSKNIMILDDSPTIRAMMNKTLKDAGYDVIEAVDGRDGLDKLSGSNARMIVTDLNMPEMNGNEFIRSVRVIPEYEFIPILVLTTESDDSIKAVSKAAGATGWITKPFNPEKLLSVVRKLVD